MTTITISNLMTIQEIAERVKDTSPKYFDSKTLKFFGQRLSSFKVYPQEDGKFKISAPRKMNGKPCGCSERLFNPETNRPESITNYSTKPLSDD